MTFIIFVVSVVVVLVMIGSEILYIWDVNRKQKTLSQKVYNIENNTNSALSKLEERADLMDFIRGNQIEVGDVVTYTFYEDPYMQKKKRTGKIIAINSEGIRIINEVNTEPFVCRLNCFEDIKVVNDKEKEKFNKELHEKIDMMGGK